MRSSLFLLIVSVLGAGALGYLVGNVIPFQEKVAVEDLTVEEDFLINSIFYEWWASAEGSVVDKSDDSITIERDGERVTLVVSTQDGRTQVFRDSQDASNQTPALATYDEVSLGSYIRTGVAIARKGTTGIAGEENVALATTVVILSDE